MSDVEKTEFVFPDEQEVELAGKQQPDTEIEIVDDTPEVDRGRKPMETPPPADLSDEELEKYDLKVQSRIKQVQKGYHEERRAKEAAQREKDEALRIAQEIVEENKKLRGSLSQGHTALIEQAKRVVATEVAAAERKYKEAAEAFDSDGMLAAQKELTAATIKADKIENFRPEALQPPKTEVQMPQFQQAPKLDEKLERWKSENEWFGQDKAMTAYALGLHEELAEKKVEIGSDAYYNRLNREIRKRFPENFDATADDAQNRRGGDVVAPATRSTAPRKIVLTKSQVSVAKRLGVPLEVYARKVAELMRK